MSLVPPGGAPARGLRVESLGPIVAGRPALLRVSVEDANTRSWHGPRQVRAQATVETTANSAAQPQVVERTMAGRGPWLLLEIPIAEHSTPGERYRFNIDAEGFGASFVVPLETRGPSVQELHRNRPAPNAGEYTIAVEGGVLTPEVPAVMVLASSIDRAGKSLAIQADDPTFLLSPERVTLDACGMAILYARPAGLAAPLTITYEGQARNLALTLSPGAVLSKIEGNNMTLAHAMGGVMVYVMMGDEYGPTQWEAMPLETATDRAVQAQVALPTAVRWAGASASPEFVRFSGTWREGAAPQFAPSSVPPCASDPARLFARISSELPAIPSLVLRYDGAQQALGAREGRKGKMQKVALSVSAVALIALSVLMLVSVKKATGVDASIAATKKSYGIAIKGIVALIAIALALLLLVQMRS